MDDKRERLIGLIESMTGLYVDGLEKLSTTWLEALATGLATGCYASMMNAELNARILRSAD